jgi:hypothetical protein
VQRVYLAESLIEGQLLIDHLEAMGIPANLFHQNMQGGLGELPVTYPEVWIKRDMDLEKADRVVHSFINRPDPVNTWVCNHCGESSPDNFEICWLCLASSPVISG